MSWHCDRIFIFIHIIFFQHTYGYYTRDRLSKRPTRRGVRAGRKHWSADKKLAAAKAAVAVVLSRASQQSNFLEVLKSLGLGWCSKPCDKLSQCVLRLRTLQQSSLLLPKVSAWRIGALLSPSVADSSTLLLGRKLCLTELTRLCNHVDTLGVKGAAAAQTLFDLATAPILPSGQAAADKYEAVKQTTEEVPVNSIVEIEVLTPLPLHASAASEHLTDGAAVTEMSVPPPEQSQQPPALPLPPAYTTRTRARGRFSLSDVVGFVVS